MLKAEEILKEKLKNIHFIRSDETFALVIDAMEEYAHGKRREFVLLVREYFQAESKMIHMDLNDPKPLMDAGARKYDLKKRILTELEKVTEREQQELPFK